MAADGFKIDVPHSPFCYLAEQGRQEFIVDDGVVWRDKRAGNRGTTHSWLRFRCNCATCNGIAIVRWDKLMEFIAEGLA